MICVTNYNNWLTGLSLSKFNFKLDQSDVCIYKLTGLDTNWFVGSQFLKPLAPDLESGFYADFNHFFVYI